MDRVRVWLCVAAVVMVVIVMAMGMGDRAGLAQVSVLPSPMSPLHPTRTPAVWINETPVLTGFTPTATMAVEARPTQVLARREREEATATAVVLLPETGAAGE